jgi:hypothetical protein
VLLEVLKETLLILHAIPLSSVLLLSVVLKRTSDSPSEITISGVEFTTKSGSLQHRVGN